MWWFWSLIVWFPWICFGQFLILIRSKIVRPILMGIGFKYFFFLFCSSPLCFSFLGICNLDKALIEHPLRHGQSLTVHTRIAGRGAAATVKKTTSGCGKTWLFREHGLRSGCRAALHCGWKDEGWVVLGPRGSRWPTAMAARNVRAVVGGSSWAPAALGRRAWLGL